MITVTLPCGHTSAIERAGTKPDHYRCPECGLEMRVAHEPPSRLADGFLMPGKKSLQVRWPRTSLSMKTTLIALLLPICASAQVTLNIIRKGEFVISNRGPVAVEVRLMQSTNRVFWSPAHYPLSWMTAAPGRPVWTFHRSATNAANFYRLEVR